MYLRTITFIICEPKYYDSRKRSVKGFGKHTFGYLQMLCILFSVSDRFVSGNKFQSRLTPICQCTADTACQFCVLWDWLQFDLHSLIHTIKKRLQHGQHDELFQSKSVTGVLCSCHFQCFLFAISRPVVMLNQSTKKHFTRSEWPQINPVFLAMPLKSKIYLNYYANTKLLFMSVAIIRHTTSASEPASA